MGWLRRAYTGDRPPPVQTEYKDREPRKLTQQDITNFMRNAEHRSGMATIAEVQWVLTTLRKSDPVRVWRIRSDLQWVSRKAKELGIEWTDF